MAQPVGRSWHVDVSKNPPGGERWLTTARFNFTYRPLSDFAIVLNENRLTDTLLADRPVRALVIKYTRLLQF